MSNFNKPPRSSDSDDEDKQQNNPPLRPGGLFNRANKPEDKPTDKPAVSSATKNDSAKKEESAPRSGGLFGGLGRKTDDKPDDKDKPKLASGSKPAEAAPRPNPLGGLSSLGSGLRDRIPIGKTDDKADAPKPAESRPGGIFGIGGRKPEDKPADPSKDNKPASSFGSKPPASTGSTSALSGNKPPGSSMFAPRTNDPKADPREAKGDTSSGNRPLGGSQSGSSSGSNTYGSNKPPGSTSPYSSSSYGSNKPADSGTSGSSANRPSSAFGSSNRPTDASSSGNRLGSAFGGDKSSDQATSANKPSSPFGSRPAANTGNESRPASSSGLFGSAKPADPKPNPGAAPKPTDARPAFGSKPGDPKAPVSSRPAGAKPADKPANALSGALGGLRARLPFGNASASAAAPAKPGDARAAAAPALAPGKKVPAGRGDKQARPLDKKPKQVVVKRTFTKDHQLDLIGIGLVLFGAIIFFGLISPNDGSFTGAVVKLIGQLFGYGRIIWPIPCLVIGGWLIIRHFHDEPPILEYHRVIGWIVMYLAFVTTLQFLELLQKPVPTLAALGKVSALAAFQLRGGGWLGDKLYMILVSTIGDYGTPVLLVGWWVISIMLALSITLAEITAYAKSVTHWFGRARHGYRERKVQAAAAAVIAADTAQAPLTVSAPGQAAALSAPVGERKPLRLGLPSTAVAPPPAANAAPVPAAASAPIAVGAQAAPRPVLNVTAPAAIKTQAPAASAPATTSAAPMAARGLFSRASSAVPAGSAVVAENSGTAPVAVAENKPDATPDRPAAPRLSLFGGRSGSKPAESNTLQPSKNPFPPRPVTAKVAEPNDSTDAKPALKPESKPELKADEKSTPPARSFGSSLFGSRSAPAASTPAKVDDQPAEQKAAAPDAKPESKPEPEPKAEEKSAPPARSFGSGLFGSRSAPAASTPAKADDKPAAPDAKSESKSESKPEPKADEKSTPPARSFGSGLFGSRPAPAASTPTKADDQPAEQKATALDAKPESKSESKPEPKTDEKNAPPARSFGSGLFGSRPAPAASMPAKVEEKPADKPTEEKLDEKPAMPKGTVGGLFAPRPASVSSTSTASPVAASKPLDAQKLDAQKVDKPADKPENPIEEKLDEKPAMPKTPGVGLFAPRPAFNNAPKTDNGNSVSKDSENGKIGQPNGGNAAFSARPGASSSSVFTARPVSKPGLPANNDQAAEDDSASLEDDEPKYVDLDDGEVPAARPTPFPRPAQPVMPRPYSGSSSSNPASPLRSTSTMPPAMTPTPQQSAPTSAAAAPPAPERAMPIIRQPAASLAPSAASNAASKPAEPASAPPLEGVIVRSKGGWELPDYTALLEKGSQQLVDNEFLMERARVIEDTLQSFGASGKVVEINTGPVITQFGVEPDYLISRQGKKTRVKVSSIAKLDADLALALAARSIRIEAPVPGKGFVGIEVPNAKTALVSLRDIMDSDVYRTVKSKLRIGLGQSVDGAPIAADLTVMPHLLIAGTTGSGKSVCVNAIIASLLLENTPDELKFIMVDPKRVELTGYNGIPHLVAPVVVDLERIVGVLKWVSREMDERYKRFSQMGARNIVDYNTRLATGTSKLPYLVVVIDELADLMMLAPDDTEKVLARLAQMARATGIHLIVSTQRPSVDVVTGLIKANFPARISFAVASSVDSRVILDQPGAEKLLGRGDMLYQSPDAAAPVRMQGVYVSDNEINGITRYWKTAKMPSNAATATPSELAASLGTQAPAKSLFDTPEPVQSRAEKYGQNGGNGSGSGNANSSSSSAPKLFQNEPPALPKSTTPLEGEEDDDEMYEQALDLVKRNGNKASIQLLQRKLRVGYMRAARLIELMKDRGVIDKVETSDSGEDIKP